MIHSYIKSAWRNIIRDKTFSLINVFGLAVGLAACLLIGLYIKHQLSYDRFHEKSDRIYRLYIHGKVGNDEFKGLRTSNLAKEAIVSEFSEAEHVTRFVNLTQLVEYDEKRIIEDAVMYADADFFKVFSFPMVRGDSSRVLSKPNQLVLTESAADKYFGDQNPIGRMMRIGGDELYQVTGICRDVPENAHFTFDILLSYSTSSLSEGDTWSRQSIFTYMVLKEQADPVNFGQNLDVLVEKYAASDFQESGFSVESLDPESEYYRFKIQPLEDIYLHSDLDYEIEPVGSISTVWIFSAIALFVLLIACINFMNLATARFASRAREVGVRKVVGSGRRQLIAQFLSESVFIVLAALIIGTALFEFSLPAFNNLIHKNLEVDYLSRWYVLPGMFGAAVFLGILAGSYPAFFLSSFKPVTILKGSPGRGSHRSRLRTLLVGVQFVITISLFISTYVLFNQHHFMTNKDTGFDQEQLLVVENAHSLGDDVHAFIEELRNYPQINNAAGAYSMPGKGYDGYTLRKKEHPEDGPFNFSMNFVDQQYLSTMNIELLKGRTFTGNYASDTGTVLINQHAAEKIGYRDPIGKYLLASDEQEVKIVGVLKDYHFNSLHKRVSPVAITFYEGPYFRYIPVKIREGNIQETVKLIQDQWDAYGAEYPFQYFFMDQYFDRLYRSEQSTARLISIFSLLAILIASLGLLGLAAFTVEKRVKEIGIRKVMGAETFQVLFILYKEILILLGLATVIAWPLSYFLMDGWLNNFAYKIQPGVLPFIVSSLAALFIAVLVTSAQALKAARTNPAYTLRDE
jgi:putative ABC transport system permease protein